MRRRAQEGILAKDGFTQRLPILVRCFMKLATIFGQTMLALLAISAAVCAGERPAGDFDQKVAPILARRCLDCHSGPDPKGKLDLSRRKPALAGGKNGKAIVPGKPDESLLWERVSIGRDAARSRRFPTRKRQ